MYNKYNIFRWVGLCKNLVRVLHISESQCAVESLHFRKDHLFSEFKKKNELSSNRPMGCDRFAGWQSLEPMREEPEQKLKRRSLQHEPNDNAV